MASAVKASRKTPEKQLITPQNQKQQQQQQTAPAAGAAATSSANNGGGVKQKGGGRGREEEDEENASHKLRGYLQVKHNPQNASGIKGRSRILRKVRNGEILLMTWKNGANGGFFTFSFIYECLTFVLI